MRVEVFEFLVKRERPIAAHGEQARQFPPAEANQVGVLGVEFVHQSVRWRGLMLRNLLNEGFVVEPMDLLELPILSREFEDQRGP